MDTTETMNQEQPPAPPVYGPMWEHRAHLGFLPALFGTIWAVITAPAETFASMRREGDIGGPLLFAVLVATPVFIVSTIVSVWTDSIAMAWLAQMGFEFPPPPISPSALAMAKIFLSPLLAAIAVFLTSGILHLFLTLVGGANRSFETTFRVCCYSIPITLFNLVPCCGWLIAALWLSIVHIIGLQQAHETTSGKAAAAVILPGLCCLLCCGAFLGLAFVMGFGAASVAHSGLNPGGGM